MHCGHLIQHYTTAQVNDDCLIMHCQKLANFYSWLWWSCASLQCCCECCVWYSRGRYCELPVWGGTHPFTPHQLHLHQHWTVDAQPWRHTVQQWRYPASEGVVILHPCMHAYTCSHADMATSSDTPSRAATNESTTSPTGKKIDYKMKYPLENADQG